MNINENQVNKSDINLDDYKDVENPYSTPIPTSNDFNRSNPYFSENGETIRADNTSTGDMTFVPFDNSMNPIPNPMQFQGLNPNCANMQDMAKTLELLSKIDITTLPFIPNPYYMMNMNQTVRLDMESTNENERQKGSFNPGHGQHPGHGHNFNSNFFPGFVPGFYPYYNPNFYPPYPVGPYPYYPQYGPGINPLTFLLLSSIHR